MRRTLLLFALVGYCFRLAAQTDSVSVSLNGASLEEFVESIEKQTDFRFFYDKTQTDSLTINVSAINQPVRDVLKNAFSETGFFYETFNNYIFLTKGEKLNLSLSSFFSANSTRPPQTIAVPNDIRPALWENKLYEIGDKTISNRDSTFTISGTVRDATTSEPMIGASVFIEQPRVGAITDANGFYEFDLPWGRHTILLRSVGLSESRRQIFVYSSGVFNIDWGQTDLILDEVTVTAQRESNTQSTQMGLQKIEMKAIKRVPTAFGEADILKVIANLPGVKTTGEASTGLNVRGGSADQNLILFNGSPILNPSHFFGLFSAFNPEIVQDATLYKSSVPAQYGGRLASVLNVTAKEGNSEKITGSAGIGLLTSRLNIEGPINNGKTTFLLGGRTTYANWLLDRLPDEYKGSRASFYDVNAVISHQFNDKNVLQLTGYLSDDRFNLNSDTLFNYGNKNLSFDWKRTYNSKLSSNISGGYSAYNFEISSTQVPELAYKLGFEINQTHFKTVFDYYLNERHTLNFGLSTLHYKLFPGFYQPTDAESLVVGEVLEPEQALESAIFISDAFTVNKKLSIDLGLRVSVYNYLGPRTITTYAADLPRTESTAISTSDFSKNSLIKTYGRPEYRASVRYAFTNDLSIKGGFTTQQQFIHSISNTASIAPTDIWKLSDNNIKPQTGSQVSLGIYNNLKENAIEASVEVYYKTINNFLDFKSGAQLVLNPNLETDVIATQGRAYGVELLLRKVKGKLNGWIGYTWSRILLKQDDPLAGELINFGEYYPANYDKPHDVSLIANYALTRRYGISLNATYSTGRPITLPAGVYNYGGSFRTLFLERNGYRIPDYFRIDLATNLDGNHKLNQKLHSFWTFGVYNLTGRRNPYSVYYVSENGQTNGYQLSIFGAAIPFVNFNIEF